MLIHSYVCEKPRIIGDFLMKNAPDYMIDWAKLIYPVSLFMGAALHML